MPRRPAPPKENSFEQSMKRLEEIVEQIETGNIPLDDIMKLYEEGVQRSKYCLEHLRQTELKLKRLGKDLEGNLELTENQ